MKMTDVRQKKIANLVDGPSFSRFPYEVTSPSNAFQSPASTSSTGAFTRPVNGANHNKSPMSDADEKPQKSRSRSGGLPHSSSSSDLDKESKRPASRDDGDGDATVKAEFDDFDMGGTGSDDERELAANGNGNGYNGDEVQSPKGIRARGRQDSEDIVEDLGITEDKESEVDMEFGRTVSPPLSASAAASKSTVLTPPLHPQPPTASLSNPFKSPSINRSKREKKSKTRSKDSRDSNSKNSKSPSTGPEKSSAFTSPTPVTPISPFSDKVPFGADIVPNGTGTGTNNPPVAPRHQVYPSNSMTPMSASKSDVLRQDYIRQTSIEPVSPGDIQFQKVDVPSVPDLPRVSPLTNQIQKGSGSNFRGFGSDSAYEEMDCEESYSRSQPQYQKVTVYLPHDEEEMIQLTVRRTCTAILLIRAVLEQYRKERNASRKSPHPDMLFDMNSYRLFMAEEDGTVDTEFPALDERCEIASTGAEAFALRKKRNENDKNEKSEKRKESVKEKRLSNGNGNGNGMKSNLRPFSVSDSDSHIGEGSGREHSKRERLSSDIYNTDLPKAHPQRKSSFIERFLCCCAKQTQE